MIPLNNFLFIHIPKCAGRSMTAVLRQLGRKPFARVKDGAKTEGFIWKSGSITCAHLDIPKMREEGYFDDEWFRNTFKFTFVRNPWERFLSLYFYESQGGFSEYYEGPAKPSFSDFTKFWYERGVSDLPSPQNRFTGVVPQVRYIFPELNFIGRVDCMKHDWHYIEHALGIPKKIKLPRINVTKHSHYSDYYNEETKKMVGELYAEDIERLGYTFDVPSLGKPRKGKKPKPPIKAKKKKRIR